MSNEITAFPSMERAVQAFLLANYPDLDGHPELIGGALTYDAATMPFYVRIDKVPGGRTTRFEGDFIIDVEVFAVNYLEAESRSLDIEALLLGYPHVVEVGDRRVVFDEVSQNTYPAELPWEDDEVSRLGATYVITARRR